MHVYKNKRNEIIKIAVKEKEFSTLELVKISFKYKGEIKTFLDK